MINTHQQSFITHEWKYLKNLKTVAAAEPMTSNETDERIERMKLFYVMEGSLKTLFYYTRFCRILLRVMHSYCYLQGQSYKKTKHTKNGEHVQHCK